MKIKKICALLLSLSLLLAMAGCGGTADQGSSASESAAETSAQDSAEAPEESAGAEAEPAPEASETEQGTGANDILADAKAVLTGELTTNEAQKLMQGNIDAVFRNITTSEYCNMVGSTAEELTEEYYAGLDIEATVFEQYFNIEYDTEELRAQIVEFYDQVYPKCDYTLGDVSRDDEGNFVATITVRPLDIINLIAEDIPDAAATFYETYTQDVVNAMTDEEYQAYDNEWANIILTVAQENLPDMGYLPECTTEMKVAKEGGYWMLTDESMQELDLLLIQYS